MSLQFLTLVNAVAPVFFVIGIGYAIRRIGWLGAEADASLMRVIVNLLFPCLILDTILGNEALAKAGNVLLAPAVGFGTVALGFCLSYYAAPVFGISDPRQRRTFAFTTGLYNYGYVPLPLIQKLFDPQTTAVLFTHNVGVEIAIWTAGIMLLTGATRSTLNATQRWKMVFNAPVIAILSAVTLHFTGAKIWFPCVALSAVHNLGSAAIPLGLILSGATFADQMRDLKIHNATRVSLGAVTLRLALIPLLMLTLARWLPCPVELRRIIVIQAAMPCALIPVLLTKHYNGEPNTAMRIVLLTSLLSFLSIPLWIQFGLKWTHQ